MSRVRHLSFLWLDGIVMDIQKDVMRDGRFGLLSTELHPAMWSGAVQSFLQEPIRQDPTVDSAILRSDECRLLYLTQEEHHTRWPFGATVIADTEIGVRVHAKCTGHGV
ncbi:hypothetical protein D8B26_002811 [Coccidioides posadasii str. Silveira]|uniref:uncharacterized protein n=1 Tax=Coccidioides posadasii (strain RMSCC 757 / Silveira) TaxID=443226 RepID=UPI001BEF93FB|nr:hypothetical protein D8B26_002811 [Coccidioides posadasii str. Silveira]